MGKLADQHFAKDIEKNINLQNSAERTKQLEATQKKNQYISELSK